MKAARHIITVQRPVYGLNEFGGAEESWVDHATLRAMLGPIEAKPGAEGDFVTLAFVVRHCPGLVLLSDRVIWRGLVYQIKALLRDGGSLTLHCEGRL